MPSMVAFTNNPLLEGPIQGPPSSSEIETVRQLTTYNNSTFSLFPPAPVLPDPPLPKNAPTDWDVFYSEVLTSDEIQLIVDRLIQKEDPLARFIYDTKLNLMGAEHDPWIRNYWFLIFAGYSDQMPDELKFPYSKLDDENTYVCCAIACFSAFDAMFMENPHVKEILNGTVTHDNPKEFFLDIYKKLMILPPVNVRREAIDNHMYWEIVKFNLLHRLACQVIRRVHARCVALYGFTPQETKYGASKAHLLYTEKHGAITFDEVINYETISSTVEEANLVRLVPQIRGSRGFSHNQGFFDKVSNIADKVSVAADNLDKIGPKVEAIVDKVSGKMETKIDGLGETLKEIADSWTPGGMMRNAKSNLSNVGATLMHQIEKLWDFIKEYSDVLMPLVVVAVTKFISNYLPWRIARIILETLETLAMFGLVYTMSNRIGEFFSRFLRSNGDKVYGTYVWCFYQNKYRARNRTPLHPCNTVTSHWWEEKRPIMGALKSILDGNSTVKYEMAKEVMDFLARQMKVKETDLALSEFILKDFEVVASYVLTLGTHVPLVSENEGFSYEETLEPLLMF